jgi:Type II secretory pathway, prepilin signal peptidase PulO and related peptidases
MSAAAVFACLAAAGAAGLLGTVIFNAVPARWLCDYEEQPSAELLGKRIAFWPHGAVLALVFAAAFLLLYRQYGNSVYFYAGCAAAMLLMLISLSDLKYRIIPDQFALLLLLPAGALIGRDLAGNRLFFPDLFSPLLGAAAGAGLMLLMGLLGKALFHREALGSGDGKLFAVTGFFAGFPGIVLLFFLAVFLSFFHIIFLFLSRKMTDDRQLPFGPYICLAFLLFLAFHSQITGFAAWYLSLLNL